MREYLERIIKPLLMEPQGLIIRETEDERGKLLSVNVSKSDTGKVIGRGGKTISAIRTLIDAANPRTEKKTSVVVKEPIA